MGIKKQHLNQIKSNDESCLTSLYKLVINKSIVFVSYKILNYLK